MTKAQDKAAATQIKRDIITHVSTVLMHIIYDSHLNGSKLWPKDGVKAHSNNNVDKDDIIDLFVVYVEISEKFAKGTLQLNLFNINHDTAWDQMDQLELIIDCVLKDGVYFEFIRSTALGMGLYRTFGIMKFDFTYTY